MGRYRCAAVALGLGSLAAGCSAASQAPGSSSAPEVVQVATGRRHTCALLAGGTVRCWGSNLNGELGDGTWEDRRTPTPVSSLSGVTAIAAGGYHTCAVLADGTVWCWGRGLGGILGNGSDASSPTPVRVVDAEGAATVAAPGASILSAGRSHTCAILADATVVCWGSNDLGQLGDGTLDPGTAVTVLALTGVRSISAGSDHTCALLENGSVRCWGLAASGQLGSGGSFDTCTSSGMQYDCAKSPVAVPTTGLGDAIAAGGYFTLLLTGSSVVVGWGSNEYGQLAPLGGPGPGKLAPTTLDGLLSVGALAAGGWHACALHLDGSVSCWGWNAFGQVGHGAPDNVGPVDGLDASSIAANWYHTCAVTRGRGLRCWGRNDYGQLGDGTTTDRPTPVPVVGFER